MSSKVIILAEDNDKLRKLYSNMLDANGFKVVCASDGEEALKLLHKVVNPALIVLDVMMPKCNGIDTCKKIQQSLRGKVPILFLSALEDAETLRECLEAGGDDYMIKSASLKDICERVKYWTRPNAAGCAQERRRKALAELDKIVHEMDGSGSFATVDESISAIATFVENLRSTVPGLGSTDDGDQIYMLGVISGIVDSCLKDHGADPSKYRSVLKRVLMTINFAELREIETLLDSYQRVANQSVFGKGWNRGQVAAQSGVPA